MNEGILVAYASRYGSTKQIAEVIGEELRGSGRPVDVREVGAIGTAEGYGAVVFGSALYIGSILKSGASFLERNRSALSHLPVAVFAAGPIQGSEGVAEAGGQLAKVLEKTPWLKPVAQQVFVGRYDPSRLNLRDRLIAALPASPLHGEGAHDDRDWATIRSWARGLFPG